MKILTNENEKLKTENINLKLLIESLKSEVERLKDLELCVTLENK